MSSTYLIKMGLMTGPDTHVKLKKKMGLMKDMSQPPRLGITMSHDHLNLCEKEIKNLLYKSIIRPSLSS
jgi:hypothetical protein